jgi:WD40 repeat protein
VCGGLARSESAAPAPCRRWFLAGLFAAGVLVVLGAAFWQFREAADARQRRSDLDSDIAQLDLARQQALQDLAALDGGDGALTKERNEALAKLAALEQQLTAAQQQLKELQPEDDTLTEQVKELQIQAKDSAQALAAAQQEYQDAAARYKAALGAPAKAAKLAKAEQEWQADRVKLQQAIASAHGDLTFLYYKHSLRSAIFRLNKGELFPTESYLALCPEEHRGWEWEFFQRVVRPPLFIAAHAGPLGRAAFSADGKLLAVSWNGEAVKILDGLNGKELFRFPTSQTCLAVSGDGKLLAAPAVGAGTDVAVWDLTTRQRKQTLTGHAKAVTCLAFSEDNAFVLAGGEDGTVRSWAVDTGKAHQVFQGNGQPVRAIAPRQRSSWIATGAGDQILLSSTKTGAQIKGGVLPHKGVTALAFTSDGKQLASAGADKAVRTWAINADTNVVQALRVLAGHKGVIENLAFKSDNRHLCSADGDGQVLVWDVVAGKAARGFAGHNGAVRGLAPRPDGRVLVSAGADGLVRGHDFVVGPVQKTVQAHAGSCNCVAFSPDGRTLATGGADKRVKLASYYYPPLDLTLEGHTLPVERVLFSPDGNWLVSLGLDKERPNAPAEIKVWDAHTGKPVHTLAGPAGPDTDIAFGRSPSVFAVTAPGAPIGFFDARDGQKPGLYGLYNGGPAGETPDPKITHLAHQADGLLALNIKGQELWESRWENKQHTGPAVVRYAGKTTQPVIGLQFVPNSNFVLIVRQKSGLQILAVPAQPVNYTLVTLHPAVKHPRQLAVHLAGICWAQANAEGTITIWHFAGVLKQRQALTFEGKKSAFTSVAFSPIGHALAATDAAGNMMLWESALPEFSSATLLNKK